MRTGSGLPQLQWDSIERFKPKYLVAVPSFLVKMAEYAKENTIDIENSSVKAAVCIGEPVRDINFNLNALGRRIKELWDLELFQLMLLLKWLQLLPNVKHIKAITCNRNLFILKF